MNETWIKLYRGLLDWCWFKDSNTLQVFIFLLLKANTKDTGFQKIIVKRGEIVTSYPSICAATGLSVRSVRTAIDHLKSTGELTVTKYSKFSLYTIENYGIYQGTLTDTATGKRQASDRQATGKRQASDTNIRIEEYKNKRIEKEREREECASRPTPPTLEEVKEYFTEKSLNGDAEAFFDNYQGVGWVKANGTPISDWKAVARNWSRKEKNFQNKPKKQSVYSSDASYDLEAYRKTAIGLKNHD